ncbi:hypothetical protein EG329_011811 [Mollisiaceae sp. DMI_Dod_QoI]|nr:hypothetical protein EG329_011811 [Helotiales sp. DMI_Dod_QoI]
MPSRSDKRDGIALSAYLSGLEVEFVDGVDPSLMSEKAYPKNWNADEPPGTLGCWRGHMDIYQKMVRERIQSAMILEDDADWDVMIKAQMTEVARGTRYLQKAPTFTHSPYGDNWDLLITGHCGLWNKVSEDQDYWIIKDDPTVIHPDQHGWWRKANLSPKAFAGNYTRVVLSPYHFTCTGSYAISLSGAARALYDQAILSNAQSIDMGLGGICKKHEYGFSTCLGTYPMVTGIHRQIGSVAKDSDRREHAGAPDRKTASSDHLVYPMRLNLGNFLRGETLLKAQYPKHAMLKEIDAATLELPRGGPAFVMKNEYVIEGKKDVVKGDVTK